MWCRFLSTVLARQGLPALEHLRLVAGQACAQSRPTPVETRVARGGLGPRHCSGHGPSGSVLLCPNLDDDQQLLGARYGGVQQPPVEQASVRWGEHKDDAGRLAALRLVHRDGVRQAQRVDLGALKILWVKGR